MADCRGAVLSFLFPVLTAVAANPHLAAVSFRLKNTAIVTSGKKHAAEDATRRKEGEVRRKEAVQAAQTVTRVLVETLNEG